MRKRKILLTSGILTIIALAYTLWFVPGNATMTFLALDSDNAHELPKNFRIMTPGSKLGISSSASGQFSEAGLLELIHHLNKQYPIKGQIWIVDLRQESHGFINGLSVSWYQHKNNANDGKATHEILSNEKQLLSLIKVGQQIELFKVIKGAGGQVAPGKKYSITAKLVETEEQLVTRHGLNYFRLFTLDHNKPEHSDVDSFIEFVTANITPHDWLHLHCRGGRGRASTYLTLLFIMFNAERMPLEDILLYQQEIGGINLAKAYTEERKLWKNDLANLRYEFIKDFYRYSKDPHGLGAQSWSTWVAQQP
jgi:hypothetical protein